MQIDGISSIPPIGSISPVQQPDGPVARASSSSLKPAATSASPASTQPVSSQASNGSSSRSQSRGGSSRGGGATTATAAALIAVVYTTTVDGKTYTGSVEEAGGEYVASAPGLPGASASGATVDDAEISLGYLIDAIA